jgi:hypothetical protein
MRTIVRSIAVLAFTAGLVVACAGAAATPTATPAPPNPTGTPVATPTAARSVGPMDPAHVSGTGTISQTSPGTTTTQGDCTRFDGAVVESAAGTSATWTNTDPRVAGATTVTISGLDCGGVGFEWGTMSQTTADGAWKGTCTGGMWANEMNGDISCWLVGSGAYKGLTYYLHSRNVGDLVILDGVILPAAPPTAP